MKLRFFDFEVTPNWWLCVFGDNPDSIDDINENVKNNFVVISSDDTNSRDKLVKMFYEENIVMSGYNIKGYDLIIANAIYQGLSPREVSLISNMIINPSIMYSTKEHMRLSTFVKKKLKNVCYQDLLDDNDGSLKEKEAILGLNILESSVSFDTENLTEENKADMIYYCKQDVYAAMYYCNHIMKGYINTKLAIGRSFNIPENICYMSTNAKLVAKALGAKRTEFLDSEKITIELPNKIKQYCYDNLPTKILEKLLTDNKAFTVNLFNNKVSFGNGGIHSTPVDNIYVEENDEWALMNVDAESYYPSMLIQFDCLSRAVTNPKVFSDIFHERIYLKHKTDKTQEEIDKLQAEKLILNTTFGASGNKYLDLYDPYMCTRCCRLGQIFLAALACKMVREVPTLKIIQTNTDGILAYFKKRYLYKVNELKHEWSRISGISMEVDKVNKIWQRDVNNYLLIKDNGNIKRKGLWLMDTWTKPGYFLISPLTAYVSQKAAIDYLVYGNNIVKSIVNNTNLLDFLITCKKGPTFKGVIQKMSNGTEVDLYKCNRIYATKDTSYGQIYKYKYIKKKGYDEPTRSLTVMSSIPEHCKLINKDLSTYTFADIQKDLDYTFYITKTIDLLDIEWYEYKNDNLIKSNKFNINEEF